MKTRWFLRFLFPLACFFTASLASEVQASELSLREVLRRTLASHPMVVLADATGDAARARLRGARGAFDLKVFADAGYAPIGFYDQAMGSVGLKQPTTLLGAELGVKYSQGADFPSYDGNFVTSERGKAAASLLLPLLRGAVIDPERFKLRAAHLGVKLAKRKAGQIRADLLAKASVTYMKWVIAHQKKSVYEKLLALAEARATLIEEQIRSGALPEIERLDNERLLATRRAAFAEVELMTQQSALELGFFLRDASGRPETPVRVTPDEDAWQTGGLSPGVLDRAIRAIGSSPKLTIQETVVSILEEELRLARNQRLPELDLTLEVGRSFGQTRPYSSSANTFTETTARGFLEFRWDVQQRKARGKSAELRAKLNSERASLRLLREKNEINVRSIFASLKANHQRFLLTQKAANAAQKVQLVAEERLLLGQSNVLELNLREQSALTQRLSQLDAAFDFHMAWAQLQALLGRTETIDYEVSNYFLTEAKTSKKDEVK